MVKAIECCPVASSWVQEVILTENLRLAVEYRNGFCCEYVGTGRPFYDLMIVWASKGHFVHQFFYPPNHKKGMATWPYVFVTAGCQKVVIVRKDNVDIGTRAAINFLTGQNVTLTVTDDPANDEVEVTIIFQNTESTPTAAGSSQSDATPITT